MEDRKGSLTRRRIIQLLAAFGVTGPAALKLAAQAGESVSADSLRSAAALIGADLNDEQIEAIARAMPKNIDQFEVFRRLEIDDAIEPAPIFIARGEV